MSADDSSPAVSENSGQLEVLNVTTEKEGNAVTTVVALKDKVYPFFVNVCYRAWQDADVIESWTEISHQEKTPVVLNQFASGYLPIRRGDVWPVSYTHLDVYKRQLITHHSHQSFFVRSARLLITISSTSTVTKMMVESCLLYTSRCV